MVAPRGVEEDGRLRVRSGGPCGGRVSLCWVSVIFAVEFLRWMCGLGFSSCLGVFWGAGRREWEVESEAREGVEVRVRVFFSSVGFFCFSFFPWFLLSE